MNCFIFPFPIIYLKNIVIGSNYYCGHIKEGRGPLWHSSVSVLGVFLKGLINPHIIWHSNRLFTLLLLNDCHLCSGPETLPKTPASLVLIYGVINVRLSVDMGEWDNRRAAPKKQIVLIKVKDIPYSFSVERHSSHVMLTLPPSLLSSLPLPVWQWRWF